MSIQKVQLSPTWAGTHLFKTWDFLKPTRMLPLNSFLQRLPETEEKSEDRAEVLDLWSIHSLLYLLIIEWFFFETEGKVVLRNQLIYLVSIHTYVID